MAHDTFLSSNLINNQLRIVTGFFGKNLNCSISNAGEQAIVNRGKMVELLGLNNMVNVHQKHTNKVIVVDKENYSLFEHLSDKVLAVQGEADALITTIPGVGIGVSTADCMPILMTTKLPNGDPIIAAVHAGWEGTFKGVIQETIKILLEKFHINPKEIYTSIGPSIRKTSYEFGNDLRMKFIEKYPYAEHCFSPIANGKYLFDLPALGINIMKEFGLEESYIDLINKDTYSAAGEFFSHRRGDAQRQMSVVGIKI